MSGRLIIAGAGGHGRAVADVATAAGWTVVGFTDVAAAARADVLGDDDAAVRLWHEGYFDAAAVGVGNARLARRAEIFQLLTAAGIAVPPLIHPRAVLSTTCRIADGAIVFPATLGAGVAVAANAVCYSGVVVEHDSAIDEHAFVGPGAILAGGVRIGAGALVGAGAVVLPGIKVGAASVVAAGAVVVDDVPRGAMVQGVPARLRQGRA